ncbi:hypothetical protein [Streptomyces qinglanensis]|uniref:hypothetical protein n=1 Tax=Streptomyces qinglanensis TaxID=943816 RepID=UPI0037A6E334
MTYPAGDPNFSGARMPAIDTLVSRHERAAFLLEQLAGDLWRELTGMRVDTTPALRIRAPAQSVRSQTTELQTRRTRVHDMQRTGDGTRLCTVEGIFWRLPEKAVPTPVPGQPPPPIQWPSPSSCGMPTRCRVRGGCVRTAPRSRRRRTRCSVGSPRTAYAKVTEDSGNGHYDIRYDVPMLTQLYQGSDLKQWEAALAKRSARNDWGKLDPQNPMALWAQRNRSSSTPRCPRPPGR